MLQVRELHAGYGDLQVLHGVSFDVAVGEILAIVGSNGAGKTTLLNACGGLIGRREGVVTVDGTIVKGGSPIEALQRGIGIVPEDRELFGEMSVEENLTMGAYRLLRSRKTRAKAQATVDEIRAEIGRLFPILVERHDQVAETLSGGEQQMLAIGRAMMSNPRVLLLDEPTLGLAPRVVEGLVAALIELARDRAIVVVEQDQRLVQSLASRVLFLEDGGLDTRAPSLSPVVAEEGKVTSTEDTDKEIVT